MIAEQDMAIFRLMKKRIRRVSSAWLDVAIDASILVCTLIVLFVTARQSTTLPTAYTLMAISIIAWYGHSVLRECRTPTWGRWLWLVFIAGVGIRLAFATHPGYSFDIDVNKGWAKSAVVLGLARSYVEQLNGNQLPSYPPLSIIMFWITGLIYKVLWSRTFDTAIPAFQIAIKLPAILADIGISALLFAFFRRHGTTMALVAAGIYALHPASIHVSAIWGQTDSVFTLALVAAVFAQRQKHMWLAGSLSAAAILLKPQAAPAVIILIAAALTTGKRSALSFTASGVLTTVLVLLPFFLGGTLTNVLNVYAHTVGHYFTGMTHGAFNLWFSLYGTDAGKNDAQLLFGFLSYRTCGLLLFALALIGIIYRLLPLLQEARKRTHDGTALMLACAMAAYSFFMLCTQMHERYLFAYIALGLPFILTGRKGMLLYAATSILFWLNLFEMLPLGGSTTIDVLHEFPSRTVFFATAQVITFAASYIHFWNFCTPKKRTAWQSITHVFFHHKR
jgi:Gpi18-like mannosyltransferase